jgi:hypothetical protein
LNKKDARSLISLVFLRRHDVADDTRQNHDRMRLAQVFLCRQGDNELAPHEWASRIDLTEPSLPR